MLLIRLFALFKCDHTLCVSHSFIFIHSSLYFKICTCLSCDDLSLNLKQLGGNSFHLTFYSLILILGNPNPIFLLGEKDGNLGGAIPAALSPWNYWNGLLFDVGGVSLRRNCSLDVHFSCGCSFPRLWQRVSHIWDLADGVSFAMTFRV